MNMLEAKWNGPVISFKFMGCPQCNTKMEHPALTHLTEPLNKLEEAVTRKALMRLEAENLRDARS